MNFYVRLAIAILVVLALAEVAPGAVNAILLLLIVGMALGRWPAFAWLANFISRIGR